jgi:hypothetical protein
MRTAVLSMLLLRLHVLLLLLKVRRSLSIHSAGSKV